MILEPFAQFFETGFLRVLIVERFLKFAPKNLQLFLFSSGKLEYHSSVWSDRANSLDLQTSLVSIILFGASVITIFCDIFYSKPLEVYVYLYQQS